jgi:hypothetical protein
MRCLRLVKLIVGVDILKMYLKEAKSNGSLSRCRRNVTAARRVLQSLDEENPDTEFFDDIPSAYSSHLSSGELADCSSSLVSIVCSILLFSFTLRVSYVQMGEVEHLVSSMHIAYNRAQMQVQLLLQK